MALYLGHVVVGHLARAGANYEVQTGKDRLGDGGRGLDVDAVERIEQNPLHTFSCRGVVTVSGDVHEAGHVTAEALPAHEQSQALALLEPHDAHGGVEEIVDGYLEKLVPR